MSIGREWIKKMWYIHTMEYYSAVRRKQILPFATTWIKLEGIMFSAISQAEKDKYQMISLSSQRENQEKMSEQNCTRYIEAKNGRRVTKWKGTGVHSWDWEG